MHGFLVHQVEAELDLSIARFPIGPGWVRIDKALSQIGPDTFSTRSYGKFLNAWLLCNIKILGSGK